jgi:hypothetical protein
MVDKVLTTTQMNYKKSHVHMIINDVTLEEQAT